MLTRRQFLLQTSALALTACTSSSPLLALRPAERKRHRYVISTQSIYWDKQDLSRYSYDKIISIPGVGKGDFSETSHNMVTIADDDGKNSRRFLFPRVYHCATGDVGEDRFYLVGNFRDSLVLSIDPSSGEIITVARDSENSGGRNFAGHGCPVPGTDAIAVGTNFNELGKFDRISIRDRKTLREIDSYSTYGFQVHDLRLTADGKYFICGHYGSYLGHGAYEHLKTYRGGAKREYYSPENIYPGSITLVEVKSGKRFKLFSDKRPGQQGHADADQNYQAYLPTNPPLVENFPNLENHEKFREGKQTRPDMGEFVQTAKGLGINLAFDPKFKEMIVPVRSQFSIRLAFPDGRPDKIISLHDQLERRELAWINKSKADKEFISGLSFHPDGKHYILSTLDGFIAVERGTHKINPSMTFPFELQIHSHMHIV